MGSPHLKSGYPIFATVSSSLRWPIVQSAIRYPQGTRPHPAKMTPKLKIRPLTSDLWSALEDLFGLKGACNNCPHRLSLSQTTSRKEQSRPSLNRKNRPVSGPHRFRRRQSRRPVPAHSPRRAALARPHITVQARRRPSRLVDLLLLHPHRLPSKGSHLCANRRSHQGCKTRQSPRPRSLSSGRRQNPQRLRHRIRHNLRPRRIQNPGPPHPTPPHHATRPEMSLLNCWGLSSMH